MVLANRGRYSHFKRCFDRLAQLLKVWETMPSEKLAVTSPWQKKEMRIAFSRLSVLYEAGATCCLYSCRGSTWMDWIYSDYLQSFSVIIEGRKLQHIRFGVMGHKSFSLTEKCHIWILRPLDKTKQDMEDLGFFWGGRLRIILKKARSSDHRRNSVWSWDSDETRGCVRSCCCCESHEYGTFHQILIPRFANLTIEIHWNA